MRDPLYDRRAPKQTVTDAYSKRRAEVLAAEIRADLEATSAYAEDHGAFADFVRAHYGRDQGPV